MINIIHSDPNFVVTESFVLNTDRGTVTLFEAEPISLVIDADDNVIIGNDVSSETVSLVITTKTVLSDILSRVQPASFGTVVEEDGDNSLVATFKEVSALECMPIIESAFSNVVKVNSIRSYKE